MTTPAEKARKQRQKARQKLRDRLRREGLAECLIADILERMAFDQLADDVGPDRAAAIRYANADDQPDDTRHRPRYIDSILRGPARATGQTARAVTTGRTIRRTDHQERDRQP